MINRKKTVRNAGAILVAACLTFAAGATSAQGVGVSETVKGYMTDSGALYQWAKGRWHSGIGPITFNMTHPVPCGGTTSLGLRAQQVGGAQISQSLTWGAPSLKSFVKASTGSTSWGPTWTYFNSRFVGAGCANSDIYFEGTYSY